MLFVLLHAEHDQTSSGVGEGSHNIAEVSGNLLVVVDGQPFLRTLFRRRISESQEVKHHRIGEFSL